MHQIRFWLGLCQTPRGSLQRPPDLLAKFKGPTSNGRGREGRPTSKGREGKEGRIGRGGGDGRKGDDRERRRGEGRERRGGEEKEGQGGEGCPVFLLRRPGNPKQR